MSKKLIAGAGVVASLAVALAPLATFATVADADWDSDKHTDTWNVTVLPTCAFGAASATPVRGVDHNTASDHPEDVTNDTNAAAWTATNNNGGTGADGVYSNNLGATPDMADIEDDEETTGVDETFTTVKNESVSTAAYDIYAGTADSNMGTTTLKVVCNQNAGYKILVNAENLTETGNSTINIISEPSATVTGYNITTTTSVTGATPANVTSTAETEAVVKNGPSATSGDEYLFTYGIGVAPGTKAATYTGDVVYTLVQQINS